MLGLDVGIRSFVASPTEINVIYFCNLLLIQPLDALVKTTAQTKRVSAGIHKQGKFFSNDFPLKRFQNSF